MVGAYTASHGVTHALGKVQDGGRRTEQSSLSPIRTINLNVKGGNIVCEAVIYENIIYVNFLPHPVFSCPCAFEITLGQQVHCQVFNTINDSAELFGSIWITSIKWIQWLKENKIKILWLNRKKMYVKQGVPVPKSTWSSDPFINPVNLKLNFFRPVYLWTLPFIYSQRHRDKPSMYSY